MELFIFKQKEVQFCRELQQQTKKYGLVDDARVVIQSTRKTQIEQHLETEKDA